ncbi:MAG: PEP-CTERM/exosortase system-associated acyltransferase [Nitrosospira sp.]
MHNIATYNSGPGVAANPHHANKKVRHYHACLIDDAAHLLEMSYALRYQVYCMERGFLRAEDYPDKLESDLFDRHSLHFGAFDPAGMLAATARLVQANAGSLPMYHHCTIFPDETELYSSDSKMAEVSRLSVSRNFRRRRGEGFYGLETTESYGGIERRRSGEKVVFALYKSIYQVSKRSGITHWLAATEKSLQRLLARYGFPFRPIGPEVDYFGPVTPYVMVLKDFDKVILEHRIPELQQFLVGLEPEFRPRAKASRICSINAK